MRRIAIIIAFVVLALLAPSSFYRQSAAGATVARIVKLVHPAKDEPASYDNPPLRGLGGTLTR